MNPKPIRTELKLPRPHDAKYAELTAHFYDFAGSDRLTRQRLKD